jgi:hypothetical protein
VRKLLVVGAMVVGVLGVAPSAIAADPCDSGAEFAAEHIVPLAQAGMIGTDHIPGEHRGLSGVIGDPAFPVC